MNFDVMVGPCRWTEAADLARKVEAAGFSGMVFTETGQTPWMSIAAAAAAAPTLTFSTGIAVAFPVSPMIAASIAWELAGNTGGRFRLGLGSQVKAHIERRYGMPFDPPGPRMRDYLLAVKDTLAAFRGEQKLAHEGPYYQLSLLPDQWRPPMHEYGDIKVDVSAVGPWMTTMAGEVADGVHVHPLHSVQYLEQRLIPAVEAGAAKAGRSAADVDLLVPVFIVPGDSPEDRALLTRRTQTQIGFYGSTRNYAFQFDDLGFDGTSSKLNERLKAGDLDGLAATITDEMLDLFAVIGPWDDIADEIINRYRGRAERVISYLTIDDIAHDPDHLDRWGEIARAVRGLSALLRSEELEAAAAAVRCDLALDDVLGRLGEPHLVGSAALGLMVWPDLDMTVVCEALDVVALHRAAVDLVSHPRVRQLTFRNDSGAWNSHREKYPDGIYWGIDYRDGRLIWNIDVWFVTDADRQPDLRHVRELAGRLTPETRSAILDIKRAWVTRPEHGTTVRSFDIYSAVLDQGIRTPEEFERYLRTTANLYSQP